MDYSSGNLVKTKNGKFGRTYHVKGTINGKIPVYLFESNNIDGKVSDKAILCDPDSLTLLGFTD